MSQTDYDLSNASGSTFRADLNATLLAIVSQNSGTTAPSTTFPYMLWADTTNGLLKQRNAAGTAWIPIGTLASPGLGIAPVATQAEQEAATSLAAFVTPGRLHFHPGVAKAWVKWLDNGTIAASYGVSSITDNGAGDQTVNISVNFSGVQYGIVCTVTDNTGGILAMMPVSPAVGSCQFRTRNAAGTQVDAGSYYVAFFGDQ